MDFSGWEKLSLVDFDDNLTTTLFTSGCNFRCPFCHNGDLVLHPSRCAYIPFSEIEEYLRKRVGVLDAVCISGGEPTLMNDLKDKLAFIKGLGYKVKLDSNGSRPNVLKELVDLGLVDYIAMDLKNSKDRYGETIGIKDIDLVPIEESIQFLLSNKVAYEFRTTLTKEFHSEEDVRKMGIWVKGANRYFLQQYVDNENCIEKGLHPIELEQAHKFIDILREYVPNVKLRGYEED